MFKILFRINLIISISLRSFSFSEIQTKQKSRVMNKIVQQYVLKQAIDKGQFGVVYYAENRETKKPFAVKQISIQKFKQTPKLTQLTNNQIRILKRIKHQNIVQFVQMIQTANNIYLVYEYCNGGTLAQHMKKKVQLDQSQIIDIFYSIRAAYQQLYENKVLHRDLKPNNILFHNGKVKLADFGFCKELLKEEDIGQSIVGTPSHMAPEILKGRIYDYRADLWSLGIILYQMVYGFLPYEQKDVNRLNKLITTTKLNFPRSQVVSQNIQNLIKRLLTVNYHQRINAVQFFKYQLDERIKPKSNNSLNFKYVALFIRRSMIYVVQTMRMVAAHIDEPLFLRFAFLLFKIISSIQKDVKKSSPYWANIRIQNSEQKWDFVLQNEANSLQNYGRSVKEALFRKKQSEQIKNQFQTFYINPRFYLKLFKEIDANQTKLQERIIDCFLINKHFSSVIETKVVDFTDYTLSKNSLQQKIQICYKFIRNNY